jgi:hypothetical protein
LKKCFLAQKSLNSIGENSSKKEKTTPNFSSFLNLKSSEKMDVVFNTSKS